MPCYTPGDEAWPTNNNNKGGLEANALSVNMKLNTCIYLSINLTDIIIINWLNLIVTTVQSFYNNFNTYDMWCILLLLTIYDRQLYMRFYWCLLWFRQYFILYYITVELPTVRNPNVRASYWTHFLYLVTSYCSQLPLAVREWKKHFYGSLRCMSQLTWRQLVRETCTERFCALTAQFITVSTRWLP